MADVDAPQTVRMTVRMQDTIDAGMMRQAILATQTRYPYYCVKLSVEADERGIEHYMLDDNQQPWVLKTAEEPVKLLGPEANDHLVAFSCWDDCVAIDFFHMLTDGTGAYNVLRTLLYEYCRRCYDANLDSTGVRMLGDTISEDEWMDPALLPKRDLHPLPVPPPPKGFRLIDEAVCPLAEVKETVNILISEQQVMRYVRTTDTSPATLFALLMLRAIGRLHPDATKGVPQCTLAINVRPALHAPLACQTLASAVYLSLMPEMKDLDIEMQQTMFRGMTILQSNDDNMAEKFWQSTSAFDQLDQIPSSKTRHEVFVGALERRQSQSCFVSYVGKANFGAAERYVRMLYTECVAPFPFGAEISAVGGTFCISLMQRLQTDVYLDAFLDELRGLGLDYHIDSRHPLQVAPIVDFRQSHS